MRLIRRQWAMLTLLAAISPTARVVAQGKNTAASTATVGDSALDARTRALASQLRCPVCQGLSIQDSPSELAQQMRDLVRQQLGQGQTPDEVKQYFVGRYGQWILMTPPASGFNWIVYALPFVALIAGATVIVVAVRRWTTGPDPSEPVQSR